MTRDARNGLRAVRVSEASHPGPESAQFEAPTVPASSGELGARGVMSLTQVDAMQSGDSDTESIRSAPDSFMDGFERDVVEDPVVEPRPRRRLGLTFRNDERQSEVDLTADSPSESGDSSNVGRGCRSRKPDSTRSSLTFPVEQMGPQFRIGISGRSGTLCRIPHESVGHEERPFLDEGCFQSRSDHYDGEVLGGHDEGDELRMKRGWKMLMLLPRMPTSRRNDSPRKLQTQIKKFAAGQWHLLMEVSSDCARAGVEAKVRASRRSGRDDIKSRVQRAETFVQLGELSAKRWKGQRLFPEIWQHWCSSPALKGGHEQNVTLCQGAQPQFLRGISSWIQSCSARVCVQQVVAPHQVAMVSQGHVPRGVLEGFRLGRVTTLRKPDGGIRGIVVGDSIRRLIARTIAQQISKQVEEATAPHQHALQTKSECECVLHMVQMLTELNPRQTVVSVDGIGAFGLVSRNAMLHGLGNMTDGVRVLPFVRLSYSAPSTHVWEDELEDPQLIPQVEGGERGDPLMPLLFSLGQHSAQNAVTSRLEESERLFAYLDDLHVMCDPKRVAEAHSILDKELWRHARIQVHQGKTKIWNKGGLAPVGWEDLELRTRVVDPVWRGNSDIPRY